MNLTKFKEWNIFKALQAMESTGLYKTLSRVFFPLVLFLYPFWNVNVGVDVADTSYNLANFTYIGQMDRMWFFSTFLANVTGGALVRLPGGNTLLGINIYTTLIISVISLACYYFLKNKMPAWIVFIGEIVAISLAWCPSVILYNYLTYLFFTLAVIFLYIGLTEEKKLFLILAGICLGINLFVRFPNIAETALILALWYYGWLEKKKIVTILEKTGWCILGFAIGVLLILGIIASIWGLGNYTDAISGLFGITSSATSYTPLAMVIAIFQGYLEGLIWFLKIVAAGFFGVALFVLVPKRFRFIASVVYAAGVLLFIKWLYHVKMFDFNYRYYLSVYRWVAVFLVVTLILVAVTVISKRYSHQEKLLAVLVLIVLGITPLGSNNQLYPNINFLFLIAPFHLFMLYRFISSGFQKESRSAFDAVRILTVVFVLAFLFQSLMFGLQFVFNEGYSGEKRDTKIKNNDIISQMLTTHSNGENLQELDDFIQLEELSGKPVFLLGDIPGLSYFLHMPFAISSPWADLPSFSYDKFKMELEGLEQKPVIIVTSEIADWITDDKNLSKENVEAFSQSDKKLLLKEYIEKNKYTLTYSNEGYGVFQEAKTNDQL